MSLFMMSHNHTENGFLQWCWPNGKSGLEQKNILVNVFDIIEAVLNREIKRERRKNNG